jgi:hypothetical protein
VRAVSLCLTFQFRIDSVSQKCTEEKELSSLITGKIAKIQKYKMSDVEEEETHYDSDQHMSDEEEHEEQVIQDDNQHYFTRIPRLSQLCISLCQRNVAKITNRLHEIPEDPRFIFQILSPAPVGSLKKLSQANPEMQAALEPLWKAQVIKAFQTENKVKKTWKATYDFLEAERKTKQDSLGQQSRKNIEKLANGRFFKLSFGFSSVFTEKKKASTIQMTTRESRVMTSNRKRPAAQISTYNPAKIGVAMSSSAVNPFARQRKDAGPSNGKKAAPRATSSKSTPEASVRYQQAKDPTIARLAAKLGKAPK